jgi:hypothetical protein
MTPRPIDRVALVAKPARRLWPEYRSKPAPAIRSRTIRYGFAGEATNRDPPVATDGPEDWTILDPRGAELGFQHPDGAVNGSAEWDADPPADAVLIGLRAADHNDDAMSGALVSMQLIADRWTSQSTRRRAVRREKQNLVDRGRAVVPDRRAGRRSLGGAWRSLGGSGLDAPNRLNFSGQRLEVANRAIDGDGIKGLPES